MNRTLRVILAVVLVSIIMFSAISICQTIGHSVRVDVTEDHRNTLSEGTKTILSKIEQPLTLKLYYSRTAALRAPDWIQALGNHYLFVRSLLREYEAISKGMIRLEIIDPRQYSQEEAEAEKQYGLEGFPLPGPEKGEKENFFFGLVVETQFGNIEKIPFLSPSRQNLLEYEITRAINTAIAPTKAKLGILSSLSVAGTNPYMAYMMQQQGRQPQPPWILHYLLQQQYEIEEIDPKTDTIADDIDMLLVIHPKDLEKKTLFAIDQFVMSGRRAMIFIDPFAEADQPQEPQQPMMRMSKVPRNSNLTRLLSNWGLQMPQNTYAADKTLAGLQTWWKQDRRMRTSWQNPNVPSVAYLNLEGTNLNNMCPITAHLSNFRMYFSGVLKETSEQSKNIERIPLLSTTKEGSTIQADSSQVENPSSWPTLNNDFIKGTQPEHMAYLVQGKFKTAFPSGIESETDDDADSDQEGKKSREDKPEKKMPKYTEAEDCTVVVVADVDCIHDLNLIQKDSYGQYSLTDNISFVQNAIEFLSGSEALIQIRSRGGMRRFTVVDEIERKAKEETEKEETRIRKQLEKIEEKRSESVQLRLNRAGGMSLELDSEKFQQAERERSQKYLELEQELRDTMNARREKIENLGNRITLMNLISSPGIILIIAITLGIYRNVKRRHYISHASDA